MDLESISDKNLGDLERLAKELLAVMRKTKLLDTPLAKQLYELESAAGKIRRERFDADDSEYNPR